MCWTLESCDNLSISRLASGANSTRENASILSATADSRAYFGRSGTEDGRLKRESREAQDEVQRWNVTWATCRSASPERRESIINDVLGARDVVDSEIKLSKKSKVPIELGGNLGTRHKTGARASVRINVEVPAIDSVDTYLGPI